MSIPCFLLTPTDRAHRYLRRYVSHRDAPCPLTNSFHNAEVQIEDGPADAVGDFWPHDDPRWPTCCDCGYVFQGGDNWQLFNERLYQAGDGREYTLRFRGDDAAPPGAMWDATWLHGVKNFCGTDGHSYMVRLPGNHDWPIDGQARNCTRPGEDHQCWVRHGEAPTLHVDKNGNTCAAGAGSIAVPGYHGFLHHGCLVEC